MDSLSQEQEDLLLWIQDRPGPTSMHQMSQLQAPNFSRQRIETLKRAALLDWIFIEENGDLVAGYSVSDKGIAVLESKKQAIEKEAKAERQQRFQNQVSVAQVLVPLVTFVLGLIVEHYAGLISAFSQLFGRWIE